MEEMTRYIILILVCTICVILSLTAVIFFVKTILRYLRESKNIKYYYLSEHQLNNIFQKIRMLNHEEITLQFDKINLKLKEKEEYKAAVRFTINLIKADVTQTINEHIEENDTKKYDKEHIKSHFKMCFENTWTYLKELEIYRIIDRTEFLEIKDVDGFIKEQTDYLYMCYANRFNESFKIKDCIGNFQEFSDNGHKMFIFMIKKLFNDLIFIANKYEDERVKIKDALRGYKNKRTIKEILK